MTIVVLYAIPPMMDTLGRLGTWIDDQPGVREFLNPRCGQPLCPGGQAPTVDLIAIAEFLVTLFLCWVGIAKLNGWLSRRRHDQRDEPHTAHTVVAPVAMRATPDLVDVLERASKPAGSAEEVFADPGETGAVVVEDEARGSMYREHRTVRLVNDRFALRMLKFDSVRAASLRLVPGCSYEAVDRSLFLPASREAALALAAFANEVSVLWTTDAWRKASELGA